MLCRAAASPRSSAAPQRQSGLWRSTPQPALQRDDKSVGLSPESAPRLTLLRLLSRMPAPEDGNPALPVIPAKILFFFPFGLFLFPAATFFRAEDQRPTGRGLGCQNLRPTRRALAFDGHVPHGIIAFWVLIAGIENFAAFRTFFHQHAFFATRTRHPG